MNKLKIILIIVLIIAIILLVVFWVLSKRDKEDKVILPDTTNQDQNFIQPKPVKTQPIITRPQISEQEKLEAQLQKLANSFAERYGSYSNQSDFENLEDLMSFMTSNLKSETENFIKHKRAQADYEDIYYGITTKALNSQVIDFSSEINQAKFRISCQRQEVFGSTANINVYYQDVNIILIKESGIWKVNEIEWL